MSKPKVAHPLIKTGRTGIIIKFKNWLKWNVAGDELHELWVLKQRIKEVGVWCSPDKKVIAISKYLIDAHDYPNQCRGTYGSIDDFREYIKTLD